MFGDTVVVTCDSGYVQPDGSSTSFTAECKETKTWDGIQSCSSKLYFVSTWSGFFSFVRIDKDLHF